MVSGDVDSNTASTLDRQIAVESRSGIAPLTVDLTAVTHLGSAGVSALGAARERARRQGSEFVLVAPPGSPAHAVCRSCSSRWSAASPRTSSPRARPGRLARRAAPG